MYDIAEMKGYRLRIGLQPLTRKIHFWVAGSVLLEVTQIKGKCTYVEG